MSRKRGKRGKPRKRGTARQGGPRLTTPEGDPLVLARARYKHRAGEEIRRRLEAADDIGPAEELKPGPVGAVIFPWYETDPEAPPVMEPMSRRVLALITLTPTELEIETMSRRRRRACRQRLAQLVGDQIELLGMETQSLERAAREAGTRPEPEPLDLPPEVIDEINERMIRQWLDESVPALGGLTPREAAKTAEGRRRLDALFDYFEQDWAQRQPLPGMYSPDYRKAKGLLGLE